MSEYEKGSLGWLREKAKEHGFGDDTGRFTRWAQQNGILRNTVEVNRERYTKTAKNAGFDNISKYVMYKRQHRHYIRDIASNQELHTSISEYEKGSVEWFEEKIKKNIGPFGYLHPCSKEVQEDMKTFGFDNIQNLVDYIKNSEKDSKFYESLKNDFGKEFVEWAKQNRSNVPDRWLCSGCKTEKEYHNRCAQKLGYRNTSERIKIRRWDKGIHEPMSENKDCSSFLGVYIGEYTLKEFLSTIFGYVKKMDYGNQGFDFVCKDVKQCFIDKYCRLKLSTDKEYNIEIKSRCLQYVGKRVGWNFTGIDYNDIADIFILVGWDNRESLRPVHIWVFHRSDIIRGKEFWDRDCFYITNGPKYLKEYKKYELIDELHILKNICNNGNYEIS